MNPVYILGFASSLSELFSMLILAAGLLLLATFLKKYEKQRRREFTATVLAKYTSAPSPPLEAKRILSPEQFASAEPRSVEQESAHRQIYEYLNQLEYICLLVNEQTLDEELVKLYLRGQVLRAFRYWFSYIAGIRAATNNPNIYSAIEAVAHRWGFA